MWFWLHSVALASGPATLAVGTIDADHLPAGATGQLEAKVDGAVVKGSTSLSPLEWTRIELRYPGTELAFASWLRPMPGRTYTARPNPCSFYTIQSDGASYRGRYRIVLLGDRPMVVDETRISPGENPWVVVEGQSAMCVGAPETVVIRTPGSDPYDRSAAVCVARVHLHDEDATVVCDPATGTVTVR